MLAIIGLDSSRRPTSCRANLDTFWNCGKVPIQAAARNDVYDLTWTPSCVPAVLARGPLGWRFRTLGGVGFAK